MCVCDNVKRIEFDNEPCPSILEGHINMRIIVLGIIS